MQNVIQAFQNFRDEMIRSDRFDSGDLRNFLEPIFEREGYRNETPSHEILVIQNAGVGDFVNLSPSLRAIRENFPNDRITLVCMNGLISLARSCPYVDSIYYLNYAFESYTDFADLYLKQSQFAEKLLPFKFDLAICFCHYIDKILLAYMSGAKRIVHYSGNLICNPTVMPLNVVIDLINWKIPMNISNMHIADRYLGLIEGMVDESIEDRSLEVWYEPRCMKTAREIFNDHDLLDKKIFAISFGGSGLQKHYPPEKYAKLIEMVSAENPDARFIILGGKKDLKETEIFMDLFNYHPYIVNLVEDLTYAETAAILSMCSMYIGNDNGAMHVAAAVETPCLVPMCFPADHDVTPNSVLQMYSPRGVPSVIIQPQKSLPECYEMENRFFGCRSDQPHCIIQIEVEKLFEGFHLLLDKIQHEDNLPSFIC